MGNSTAQNSEQLLAREAAVLMKLLEGLREAALSSGAQVGGRKMQRFDSTSLAYESARNLIAASLQTARKRTYDDVPRFLSHDTLLQSKHAPDVLRAANHLLFMDVIENILDGGASPANAALSRRGYGGDRPDVIEKLRGAMDEYKQAAVKLGGAIEMLPSLQQAKQHVGLASDRQQREVNQEILRQAGPLPPHMFAAFSSHSLSRLVAQAERDKGAGAIFAVLHDGQIKLQAQNGATQGADAWDWGGVRRPAQSGLMTDQVILAKFRPEELLFTARADGAETPHMLLRIEQGQIKTSFIGDASLERMQAKTPQVLARILPATPALVQGRERQAG